MSLSFLFFRMKDLSVMDSTCGALYPKIVSIVNQEVFNLKVCIFSHSLGEQTLVMFDRWYPKTTSNH